jgi:hypothetical protein
MKSLLVLSFLLVVILHNLFGEIKNGYEKDIRHIRLSLQSLKDFLAGSQEMTAAESRRVKANIRSLMEYLVYHDVTNRLLDQFKRISPDLYHEIHTLKDSKGRSVDVYVKFVHRETIALDIPGIVLLRQSVEDAHTCMSEYGQASASVLVSLSNSSLMVLSHEFGHLKYIVPNLSTYLRFYKRANAAACGNGSFGHSGGDLSGINALRYEKMFRLNFVRYRKVDSNEFVAPLALLTTSRRNIVEMQNPSALAMRGVAAPVYGAYDGSLP